MFFVLSVHPAVFAAQRVSAVMKGADSHKQIDLSENPLLRIYYKNRVGLEPLPFFFLTVCLSLLRPFFLCLELTCTQTVLFFMCAANELFLMALYFLHFTQGTQILRPLTMLQTRHTFYYRSLSYFNSFPSLVTLQDPQCPWLALVCGCSLPTCCYRSSSSSM